MAFDADAAAARWLDDAGARPTPGDDSERLALAWALKEHGYAVIYTDLARAQAAAARAQALIPAAEAMGARIELGAVAAWIGGAVDALRGEAAAAVARLDAAYDAFHAQGALAHAAASQVPKIIALSMLGRHDEALACGQRTLQQFAALGDWPSAGKVDINLGSMLLRQERYDEAALHYRRAAVRFAKVNDRQLSVTADIGLAGVLSWQFEFDEALRIYERAEARVQAHGLTHLRGIIDSSRGLLELHRGRHAVALRWLESALREFERDGPPHRLLEARMDLASAYLALNLLPEAALLYQQAVDGFADSQMPLEQAWACAHLASTLLKLGRCDEAQAPLQQARRLFEAQGQTIGLARLDTHAAARCLARDEPGAALELADRAAGALAACGMRGWWLEAQALAAEALLALRRYDDAWARFEGVIDQAGEAPETLARGLTGQGLLLRRRGRADAARACLERAADAIERQQAGLHGDEFRTAYGADKQGVFEALIELALDDPTPGATARLLACMERARARALALGLQQRDGDDAAAAGHARSREALHWLQQQQQQALAGGDAARAAPLQARALAIEGALLEAHRRHQALRGEREASLAPALASAAALQARLGDDEALVEYAWLGTRLVVVVLRRDRLHHAQISAVGLAERIEQLRFQLDTLRFGATALRRHAAQMGARTQQHLHALHQQVWAPIARWLDGAERVVVVPHRALHYLPFCALHDGGAALVDRHAISLAPSAALWRDGAATPPRRPQRALVLGLGGAALPHVRREVEAVREVFAPQAVTLLDAEATLPALKQALPQADLLHLACHGQFRADSPYFSSLQLADGALTLRDAAALPLDGVMVTLSACETGLSRVAPGDELLGLMRGFLLAGAPAVLATLWTVDDASTAGLMTGFYGLLREGHAPAEALRQAQRQLREQQPHPYFWAPFVVHGRS